MRGAHGRAGARGLVQRAAGGVRRGDRRHDAAPRLRGFAGRHAGRARGIAKAAADRAEAQASSSPGACATRARQRSLRGSSLRMCGRYVFSAEVWNRRVRLGAPSSTFRKNGAPRCTLRCSRPRHRHHASGAPVGGACEPHPRTQRPPHPLSRDRDPRRRRHDRPGEIVRPPRRFRSRRLREPECGRERHGQRSARGATFPRISRSPPSAGRRPGRCGGSGPFR